MSWALVGNRLALGVEPLDAVLGTRLARAIHVDVERPGMAWLQDDCFGFRRIAGSERAPMSRHDNGRHAMIVRDDLGTSVDLRLYDRRRGWVPRRLSVPLPDIALPVSAGTVAARTRRPVLFPGVAWDLVGGATALRARVLYGGLPVRWARLEARRPDEIDVVLRTRADDRGEFLLILAPTTLPMAELESPLELDVEAFGPNEPGEPPPVEDPDPLWDLPLETLATPGEADDAVAEGRGAVPDGWISRGTARVTLEIGRTVSDPSSFDF